MPRSVDQARRDMWAGLGDAYTSATELLAVTAAFGAGGYGLDRLLHTWPILFVVGTFGGFASGAYMLWIRTKNKLNKARGTRGA